LKLESWNVPIFGRVAGIGRAFDDGKTSTAVQKTVAASLEALVTGASYGSAVVGGTIIKNKFPGGVGPTNQTSLRIENTRLQKDLSKLQNEKWGANSGLMGHTTPGGIRAESSVQALQGRLGGAKDYPIVSARRADLRESKWATDQTSGATGPAFYERNNPVYGPALPPIKASKTKTPTATTVPKPTVTTVPTATTVPKPVITKGSKKDKTTATTVPKASVTTVPTSASPPSTAPRQYDSQGKGIGEPLDIRVGDPMPVKPDKPIGVSKAKFAMSDQQIDYEVRLANYYRYNKITPPKKK
jgi:hypothetical protein